MRSCEVSFLKQLFSILLIGAMLSVALFGGWIYYTDLTTPSCDVGEKIDSEPKKNKKTFSTADGKDVTVEFDRVDFDYFDDALFIGDSRTVGLGSYARLATESEADFFAKVGLTAGRVFNVTNNEMYESTTLLEKLKMGSYGKIYIMFGVNELPEDLEKNAAEFCTLLETVRKYQPDAIVFIQANLHVGKYRSESWEFYSNERLELYNRMIALNADHKNVFYLDINEGYDDAEGNLVDEYTSDDLHLDTHCYEPWEEYLKSHAIVK